MFGKFLPVLFVVFSIGDLALAQGWDCFKCSSTMDELCITNPESISSGDVTVSNCTGYCTIIRTEFTDIPGKVISLIRDCEKEPLILNDIRTDAHYTKYYRSCTTNKCNSGDGIIGGGGGNGNLPSEIIQVPEKSNANKIYISIFQTCLTVIISIVIVNLT